MGKSYSEIKSEMSQIAYYKWQFLRRNEDYKKEFDSFIQRAIHFKRIKSQKNQKALPISLLKKLQKLKNKWCITPLTDYRDKNPKPLPEIGFDRAVYELGLKDKCRSNFIYFIKGKNVSVPYVLNIAVNLSYPITKIKPLVERMIVERIKLRKKILKEIKQPGFSKHSQLSLDKIRLTTLYDEYLGVWDYVQAKRFKQKINSKEKWIVIATKLYPDHAKEAGMQCVRDRYNEADRLIKGGYKEIK